MATERKLPKSVDQALRTALELLDECKSKIPAGWPEKVMVEEATLQLVGGIQLNEQAEKDRIWGPSGQVPLPSLSTREAIGTLGEHHRALACEFSLRGDSTALAVLVAGAGIQRHLEDISHEVAQQAGHQRPGLWRV
jgi:hypothetical protein